MTMTVTMPEPRPLARRALLAGLLVLALAAETVHGRGYLHTPAARNVVYFGAYKAPWEVDAFDGGGAAADQANGHGVCGGIIDDPVYTMLENGNWASGIQKTYTQGDTFTAEIVVTDHLGGHVEMRLCELDNITTQACLNTHVLEFDLEAATTYPGEMPYNLSSPADYGSLPDELRCDNIADAGPVGLCCNGGGTCSPEEENRDRWVLPDANTMGPEGASLYLVKWVLPEDVACAHCVLQMAIVDASVGGAFPSATYNCADIAIEAAPEDPEKFFDTVTIGAIAGGAGGFVLLLSAVVCFVRRRRRDDVGEETRWYPSFTLTRTRFSAAASPMQWSPPRRDASSKSSAAVSSNFGLSTSSPQPSPAARARPAPPLPQGSAVVGGGGGEGGASGVTSRFSLGGSALAGARVPSFRLSSLRLPSLAGRQPRAQASGGVAGLPPPPPPPPPPGRADRQNMAYRYSIDSDDV